MGMFAGVTALYLTGTRVHLFGHQAAEIVLFCLLFAIAVFAVIAAVYPTTGPTNKPTTRSTPTDATSTRSRSGAGMDSASKNCCLLETAPSSYWLSYHLPTLLYSAT